MILHWTTFDSVLYHQSMKLRETVLRHPLGMQFTEEDLAIEQHQKHLVVYSSQKEIIGGLSLVSLGELSVKLRQMWILPQYQGMGIGRKVVEEAHRLARAHHAQEIYCHARENAMGFYEKMLYSKEGNPFLEVGLTHYVMRYLLTENKEVVQG